MSARRCVALLLAVVCMSATAGAAVPGDVNQDCKIDTADAIKLSRAVMGGITLNADQQDAADVAPIVSGSSAPDGAVTVADLVVLLRAVAGLQVLPSGVNIPRIDSPSGQLSENYVTVTGQACAGELVRLYINTRLRGTVIANADHKFSFTPIGINYLNNTIKATSTANGETSTASIETIVTGGGPVILWDNPALTGDITVWPPPLPPMQGYYKVNSDFEVPVGKTLILPPGTIVKFQTGTGSRGFEVTGGRLLIQGATGAAVTLEKLDAIDSRWDGVHITAGQETLIQSAKITGANRPLELVGANTSAALRGSELYDFLDGVTASAGASVTVDGSYIHYGSTTGRGIVITNANLTVTDSVFYNLASGIDVSFSSFATIGPGNEFRTFRDNAIRIAGPADGIIIGNEINASADPPAAQAQWGINLINSSPEIRANRIHGAETGIRVAGNSNPLITDGNECFENIWGIWLEGSGANSVAQPLTGNPNPVITSNSIYENSGVRPLPAPPFNTRNYCSSVGANVCISDYPSGSNAVIDARGNYWGTDDPTAIRGSIIDPDVSLFAFNSNNILYNTASDPVAIDLSNFADSATSGPGTIPLFLNAATGLSHIPSLMAPTLGDTLSVQFTLATPADVILRIYKENTTAPVVREISMPGLGAGPHTIPWDGKDGNDNFVSDEAYTYVLSTSVAGFTDVFNPAVAPSGSKVVHTQLSNGSQSFPPAFNLYRNKPLKILFDVANARGRVRVNRVPDPVQYPGSPTVTLADFVAFPEMYRQLFVYNGFGPTGAFVGGGKATYWFHPEALQRNAVIVERTAPLIAGPAYVSLRYPPPANLGQVNPPAIEVKGDPYLVRLSYDQLSRIAFCIDQAAYLTVRILEPGSGNPDVAANVVATLLQDTTTPHAAQNCNAGGTPYVVEWDGTEPGAADPYVMQPVEDGSYTFTIEARNALQTNLRSIYRGIVQTRQ